MSTGIRLLFTLLIGVLLASAGLMACGRHNDSDPSTPPPAGPSNANRPAAQLLTPPPGPRPVSLPADDAPHDTLTEWWYYTGHLTSDDGQRYGFEFVIFQSQRNDHAPIFAAHYAITDVGRGTFHVASKAQPGAQPNSGLPFSLHVHEWALTGGAGDYQIRAAMPSYQLELSLQSTKPPVLHDEDGFFEFAPGTASYYYSHTRLQVSGTLAVNGAAMGVTGQAWMDHQWGNFLVFGRGGWDWFSIQMDDGRELMLWHSRDAEDRIIRGSGTLIEQDGSLHHLELSEFDIQANAQWTSPQTGATYPSGWTIRVPKHQLELTLTPVLQDQELRIDGPHETVYWEGAVSIQGSQNGNTLAGDGYVELTGYEPG